jgi:dolichyl-phosphate beta-glucosyltransferase
MKRFDLSIVIPVYNEEKRLGGIKKIKEWLKNSGIRGEVIVVNDGSTDRTSEKIKCISYFPNRGKGYAVKQGVLASKGKWVMFCDVDLSVDTGDMLKIWKTKKDNTVIIASRRTEGAKIATRQSMVRELLGVGFSWLAKVFSGVDVSDFTCGCKLFPGKKAKIIFKDLKTDRWAFDAEVLWRAQKMGMKIIEVPVVWKNSNNSRVRLGSDILTSFFELMQMQGRI